jgi:DNA-binding PadR family transcriptional regulator
VNNSPKTFDFREAASELVDFVRSRAEGFGRNTAATPATASQIELAVLAALGAEGQNATQITNQLKVSAAGAWQPTAGDVHRALAALIAAGSAAETVDGDRKVYAITEAGFSALKAAAENQADATDAPEADKNGSSAGHSAGQTAGNWAGRFNWNSSDFKRWADCDPNFIKTAAGMAPVLGDIAQNATREQQQRATEVLAEARRRLHAILAEG